MLTTHAIQTEMPTVTWPKVPMTDRQASAMQADLSPDAEMNIIFLGTLAIGAGTFFVSKKLKAPTYLSAFAAAGGCWLGWQAMKKIIGVTWM